MKTSTVYVTDHAGTRALVRLTEKLPLDGRGGRFRQGYTVEANDRDLGTLRRHVAHEGARPVWDAFPTTGPHGYSYATRADALRYMLRQL